MFNSRKKEIREEGIQNEGAQIMHYVYNIYLCCIRDSPKQKWQGIFLEDDNIKKAIN